ncbi:Hypothetical protein A7982_05896 [Minicystis rosea]|nr:Hypothetical protein A7982_05896 [Minicystis rosea]
MSEPEILLASLREAGAEAFDPPGFGLVLALLSRAEGERDGARERIRARARERIDRLQHALESARTAATRDLSALVEAGVPVAPTIAEALARGEIQRARSEIRRARHDHRKRRDRVELPWVGRLRDEARARGAALPQEMARDLERLAGDGVARDAHGHAVALGSAVSSALLTASAESVRATIAVARAADNVPDAAGPYNGQVLAARALAAMADLSPAYVRAVVAAIDDLAGMEARLTPEAPKPKAKPAKRKRAAGG